MGTGRWLGVCRWLHVLLVFVYVFVTIMALIVLLVVVGMRMPDGVRWAMLLGWFAICFGGALMVEWMGWLVGQGCRKPIKSEEERLSGLIGDVETRMGSTKQAVRGARFFIRTNPTAGDGSFGYQSIIVSSGTLLLASDEELRGILAHEWGHLRDGDRILESAFFCSGIVALGFRAGWQVIRHGFRVTIAGGLILLAVLSPVLLPLLFFFLLDLFFRVFIWELQKFGDYRQDRYSARAGCGKGLRDWLEKSGLATHVDRIRRLEKML